MRSRPRALADRLSGFVQNEESPIAFAGVRSVEKPPEELLGDREPIGPTGVEKVTSLDRDRLLAQALLQERHGELRRLADDTQPAKILTAPQALVRPLVLVEPRGLRPGEGLCAGTLGP
jgi:FlaA1/EpsC-like NDP-sugar epimerase